MRRIERIPADITCGDKTNSFVELEMDHDLPLSDAVAQLRLTENNPPSLDLSLRLAHPVRWLLPPRFDAFWKQARGGGIKYAILGVNRSTRLSI